MDYLDKINYMEGIIVGVDDCSVSIDLKGRLGFLKIPRRLLITNWNVEIGQEVGFNMSYPEILNEKPNEKYISNMNIKGGSLYE